MFGLFKKKITHPSEVTQSSSNTTIFIELKNEGTFVCKPVEAKKLNENVYQIIGQNTAPDDEEWEFTTGDIVECQIRTLEDQKNILIAVKKYKLNSIEQTKRTLKAIAMIEAIVSPKWEYRYFSYNSKWSPETEMASMRNGEGSEWFLWIRENIMAWKYFKPELGVDPNIATSISSFPSEFQAFISEAAITIQESSSLCYFSNDEWHRYGSEDAIVKNEMEIFHWTPQQYKEWADGYYEKNLDISAISSVFESILNEDIISRLNPKIKLKDLQPDIDEIGF